MRKGLGAGLLPGRPGRAAVPSQPQHPQQAAGTQVPSACPLGDEWASTPPWK